MTTILYLGAAALVISASAALVMLCAVILAGLSKPPGPSRTPEDAP